jgi:hypothetical protein
MGRVVWEVKYNDPIFSKKNYQILFEAPHNATDNTPQAGMSLKIMSLFMGIIGPFDFNIILFQKSTLQSQYTLSKAVEFGVTADFAIDASFTVS